MTLFGIRAGVVAAALLSATAPPALAEPIDDPCEFVGIGSSADSLEACLQDEDEEEGDEPTPQGPPSRFILDLEGEPPCWQVIAIRPSHPRFDTAFEVYEDAVDAGVFIYDELLPWVQEFADSLILGGTSDGADDLVLPCDALTPDVQAYLAWRDTIVLPPPAGELDPGDEVVTGMDTYLQIGAYEPDWDSDGAPQTVTYTGPIRIVATAEHQVDWGDGTVTPSPSTWHATNGRPWMEDPPDDAPEPITHVYQDATEGDSMRTITVTTRWTARWSTLDGSLGGVVPFFRYSESAVDLDVDEVQSVVVEQS